MGRKCSITPEIAEAVCEKLASGLTLREICRAEGMPPESTVRLWAMDDQDGFAAKYKRAREIGYQSMADELLEISDDGTNDWMKRNDQDGEGFSVNGENIQRSRLRIDTRKWMLAKALPKVYGDKLDLVSSDGTMTPQVITRTIVDPKGDAGA